MEFLAHRHSRESGNPGFQLFFKKLFTTWIPAFAGMTALMASSARAAYDLPQILSQLEKKEQTIDAIKFRFEQQVSFKQMNTESALGGEALFAKSGKLRISKEHPE